MASSTYKTTILGKWVDELINAVYFQPDDGISAKAVQDGFSPDIKIRINGEDISREKYLAGIDAARAKYDMSVHFNNELIRSLEKNDGDEEGSVAHISEFTLKDKETGVAKIESSIVISTVRIVNGKKLLTELTEVYRSAVAT